MFKKPLNKCTLEELEQRLEELNKSAVLCKKEYDEAIEARDARKEFARAHEGAAIEKEIKRVKEQINELTKTMTEFQALKNYLAKLEAEAKENLDAYHKNLADTTGNIDELNKEEIFLVHRGVELEGEIKKVKAIIAKFPKFAGKPIEQKNDTEQNQPQ